MKHLILLATAVLLSACSPDVPENFAAPAEERERLVDALDAECNKERANYWFCTAENGFFHVFTEQSEHAGLLVKQVMLDRNSSPEMMAEAAELYGFSPEQVQAVVQGSQASVESGPFILLLDATWNEPVIQLATPGVRTAQK